MRRRPEQLVLDWKEIRMQADKAQTVNRTLEALAEHERVHGCINRGESGCRPATRWMHRVKVMQRFARRKKSVEKGRCTS